MTMHIYSQRKLQNLQRGKDLLVSEVLVMRISLDIDEASEDRLLATLDIEEAMEERDEASEELPTDANDEADDAASDADEAASLAEEATSEAELDKEAEVEFWAATRPLNPSSSHSIRGIAMQGDNELEYSHEEHQADQKRKRKASDELEIFLTALLSVRNPRAG
jgi:hypothetical protein